MAKKIKLREKYIKKIVSFAIVTGLVALGYGAELIPGFAPEIDGNGVNQTGSVNYHENIKVHEIPEYTGESVIIISNNVPGFDELLYREIESRGFEQYSEPDSLGRCGPALARIDRSIMPTEERGSIGQVKPVGWHTVKYENVDGKYLYNRCHLIAYQLAGENANERNLITGTRQMNLDMVHYENLVANYVRSTGNSVLYRVTPIYEGENLLCKGVQIEAYSPEDEGEGISFNVFVYNVQEGIKIDYKTGESQKI